MTSRSNLITHSILRVNAYRALPASPLTSNLRRRPAAAAVLAGTAIVLAGEALSAPLPAAAAAWGGVALAAWCGALLAACSALTDRDGLGLVQWKIGSWFLLWCAVTDGLASIAWANPQYGLTGQILPSSVARAEWFTAVAATGWAVGYCGGPCRLATAVGLRFMRSVTDRRPGIVRSPMTPWLLYAVGTAARLVEAILTGNFGYTGSAIATVSSAAWYQQALTLATLACPVAIAVAGLRMYRERAPGAKATLAVLLAAEITTAAVMGIKGQFVTAVIAVAIARASAGRGMPRGLLLAAVAFFLLIVIPFTVAYRAEVRGGPVDLSPRAAAAEAPAVAGSAASSASLSTIPGSVSYLVQRLQEIEPAAIVLQRTPSQVAYASPAQIPETLAADLIPRALWPGKPILDSGYQFSQEYYGTSPGEVTAAAITPQADLYRYGGWVPMLAGMLILGWLIRVLDDVLDVRGSPQAALLVLLLWSALATPEGTFTVTLLGLPSAILTWLAITAVTFRQRAAC
jgi:hypothetical protein